MNNKIKQNDIEIKKLIDCQEHIPQLAVLWYEEISRHWVPGSSIERAHQNLILHSNREQMPLTFVALHQGQPIGMASLRVNDGIRTDLIPWLGSLIVHPHYRSNGVATQLMETVKQHAKHLGHSMLYLLAFDKTIPQWYASLGWQGIGNDTLFEHPVAVMQFSLF